MNTEEIELDLKNVWEEIDLLVKLCGGDPSMVTTDHNKIATRRNIEDGIQASYQAYAAKAWAQLQCEAPDTRRLKASLSALLKTIRCKQEVDAAMVAEMARAEELIA